MLKVKDYLPFEELRKYGFKPREEWDEVNMKYCPSKDSYVIFAMDLDEDRDVYEDNEVPVCYIEIEPKSRYLWCEAIPCCSYYIEGDELDIITDTIYKMTLDGILEIKE